MVYTSRILIRYASFSQPKNNSEIFLSESYIKSILKPIKTTIATLIFISVMWRCYGVNVR